MSHGRFRRLAGFTAVVVAQCLGTVFGPGAPTVRAQQLSIRHYDVSDGLAHSHVTAMHQDAKGYLWLATWEGLSRFDGYGFTNFGTRDGLGDPIINAVTEDNYGNLWVAANGGGVALLIHDPLTSAATRDGSEPGFRQKFVSFRVGDSPASNRVNSLLFDSRDNLWCATDAGLYRGQAGQSGDLKFEAVIDKPIEMNRSFQDSHSRLWFGMQTDLVEVVDDRIIHYGAADEIGHYPVTSVVEDRQGRLLAANEREIFEFVAPSESTGRGTWRKLPLTLQPDQGINTMVSDSDGTLWIGTWHGLIKYKDAKQTVYSSTQGLSDNFITALTEDRDRNLWIGSIGGGVCKLSSEAIVSFTKTEGLPNQNVAKVIEDRTGQIYASVENGGVVKIVDEKAVPLAESQVLPFSTLSERILQDQHGDWWIGTDVGPFRFEGPELQLARGRMFGAADGIAEARIEGGLYEDPTGKVWISPLRDGLYIFDPARKGRVTFEHIPPGDIWPFASVVRMISDRSSTLWLGAHELLGRLVNGRVEMLQPTDGLPETDPRSFFLDSRGWLWIGLRYKGVSVSKDPAAANPTFVNYSTANGLASDAVWAIAEDNAGRMYLGTGKGLDQLDLNSGRIRHFNTDDGLASDIINYCLKDKSGNIWVATSLGLSKLNSRAEHPSGGPPPIYLSRVQVAGEDLSIPESGASSLPEVDLAASRDNLLIEYVALSFQGEHKLRYQYKLEGVDADWSPPTEARSINYAHLAAGSYQFLVRAINQDGIASSEPATFQFRIMPPIWQRWWVLTLLAIFIGLAVYILHRQRVGRLLELERVRTRIATDLHDDIGANLSLIAMQSEVAGGMLKKDDRRMKEWFSTIAATSRDTVDAMSDIVWAINPKRDQVSDLTLRMRRFAEDFFAAREIELEFNAPVPGHNVTLGADLRREVFLIFKETINNIVRHSGCTAANIDLHVARGWLELVMSDNGRGFDPSETYEGNGLASMRQRAKRVKGNLEVASTIGNGTTVTLKVPIGRRKYGPITRSS